MKILLVQPKKPEIAFGGDDFAIFEPLALEYLAASVSSHHDVRVLDLRLEDEMDAVLREFRPDLVGVTAYTVHMNEAKRLCEKVKRFNPEIFTVTGGHHASVSFEDFAVPAVDLIVSGEGITPFRELVSRLEQKKDLAGIPGTVRRENGETVVCPNPPAESLDSFPFPDRSTTRRYRRRYFSEWMKPIASVRTSKGCPFRCKFCALWKLTGGKYLTRKPEKIVEELAGVEEDFVFFTDDESFLDVKRMRRLAELIDEAGIRKRYYCYLRSDTTVKHPDLIEQWKKIGLERVFMGLEFFRDEDLDYVKKGSTTKNNAEAVRIIQSLDIDIFPAFIIRPEFDREDFRQFSQYCLNLGFNFIGFSVLTPLPGTDLYEETKDRFIVHNYDYFDFVHTILPTKLPIREFYREFFSLYGRTRSVRNQIAFLEKYPLHEIPALLKMVYRFSKKFNNIYNDYPQG